MAMSSAFRSICEQVDKRYIIYDARLAGQISADWFDPDNWYAHADVQALAVDRGQSWLIHSVTEDYVLHHYCRSTAAAKPMADWYLWLGLMRTRAWREYQLLVKLQDFDLPAPRPLAARVQQQGCFYQADLLTRHIPASQSLSHILAAQALDASLWQAIGKGIRAFHRRNIYHAKLNAQNILLDKTGRIYLIDFDKSGIDQDKSWQQRILERLHRSLLKLHAQDSGMHFSEADWQSLLAGYNS